MVISPVVFRANTVVFAILWRTTVRCTVLTLSEFLSGRFPKLSTNENFLPTLSSRPRIALVKEQIVWLVITQHSFDSSQWKGWQTFAKQVEKWHHSYLDVVLFSEYHCQCKLSVNGLLSFCRGVSHQLKDETKTFLHPYVKRMIAEKGNLIFVRSISRTWVLSKAIWNKSSKVYSTQMFLLLVKDPLFWNSCKRKELSIGLS